MLGLDPSAMNTTPLKKNIIQNANITICRLFNVSRDLRLVDKTPQIFPSIYGGKRADELLNGKDTINQVFRNKDCNSDSFLCVINK